MKMEASMKSPRKMKMEMKKTKMIKSKESLCILCYALYVRCKLTCGGRGGGGDKC